MSPALKMLSAKLLVFTLFCFLWLLFTVTLTAQESVQDWQVEAIKKHPDLAVEGSPFHRRFVNAYKEKQASSPDFFSESDWPAKLANEVDYQIVTGALGGSDKSIRTRYIGSENLFGNIVPYDRLAVISMSIAENGKIFLSFIVPSSKEEGFILMLTPAESDQFFSFMQKALEWHATAEKERVKDYSKPLGVIGDNKFSFVRSATGETHVSVIYDKEGAPLKLTGQIELEGIAASIELLKTRTRVAKENAAAATDAEQAKQKTDRLFDSDSPAPTSPTPNNPSNEPSKPVSSPITLTPNTKIEPQPATSVYDKSSLEQLTILAKNGDAEAQHSLGSRYLHGQGVTKDVEKAFALMSLSAAHGSVVGARKQGFFYENGWATKKDYNAARKCYETAVSGTDVPAMYLLGQMYMEGKGVGVDYVKAKELLQVATDSGYTQAMVSLAWLYDRGYGVAKDSAKAFALYQKAAEKGSIEANLYIGTGYHRGEGAAQDDKIATDYWRKAGDSSGGEAMTMLAAVYASGGTNVPIDLDRALFWANKAKEAGHPKANFLIETTTSLLQLQSGGKQTLAIYNQAQTSLPPVTSFGMRLSQGEAIRAYPNLGIKGSLLNSKYWEIYKAKRQTAPNFFDDDGWPMALAHEAINLSSW